MSYISSTTKIKEVQEGNKYTFKKKPTISKSASKKNKYPIKKMVEQGKDTVDTLNDIVNYNKYKKSEKQNSEYPRIRHHFGKIAVGMSNGIKLRLNAGINVLPTVSSDTQNRVLRKYFASILKENRTLTYG